MKIRKEAINLTGLETINLVFDDSSICPICNAHISGKYLSSAYWNSKTAIMFFCTNCDNVFINVYDCFAETDENYHIFYSPRRLIKSAPKMFAKRIFDDTISRISPTFDNVYNQALQAESEGLDQLAGIGYRKAVEFLVKDFAIRYNKDDEEKIKKMALSNCIKEYVDDPRIKSLAEKAVWLGNDETHYVRKHEDKDITDMKRFIDAMVYFISMVLITEDADSMQKA